MADDTLLTYGAIGIEGLITAALIMLCIKSEKLRSHAIVVLGSIAPILVFYLGARIEFVRDPTDPSARFAFYAMWIMGFGFFLKCVAASSLISLIPKPASLCVRFLLGGLVSCVMFVGVIYF